MASLLGRHRDTAEGISWIEQGIRDYRATGTVLGLLAHLARKAEALHLADRTSEALEAPQYDAPYLTGIAKWGADLALQTQYSYSSIVSPPPLIVAAAAEMTAIATFEVIEPEVAAANKLHSDLWLTGAVRVIFMLQRLKRLPSIFIVAVT